MTKDRLVFAFDFVDPGSYLIRVLSKRWMEGSPDPRVRMLPLELRPPPEPLLAPSDPAWAAMERELGDIAEREDIPFDPPGFVPWTRKAHELALHGGEVGVDVHDLLFRARFGEGLDIGRVDVLVTLAGRAGLDEAEVRTVLGVDRFGPRVEAARAEARELGIRGVPTLLAGEERLEGLRTVDELEAFLVAAGLIEEKPA